MNSADIAPMAVAITFIVVTGLVVLLRPISKRLGVYLEVLAEERRRMMAAPPIPDNSDRIATLLESMDHRMARIEERQDFTDRLLVERPRQALKDS